MTARPKIARELAELIEAQARDDARDRLDPSRLATREADLSRPGSDEGFSLNSLADTRCAPPDARLIAEEEYARRGQAQMAPPIRVVGDGRVWTVPIIKFETSTRCPVCHDNPLPKPLACLVCHASAYDPTKHDMQESPKAAAKRSKLGGGMGATLTPGKRGRKSLWADYQPAGKVAP